MPTITQEITAGQANDPRCRYSLYFEGQPDQTQKVACQVTFWTSDGSTPTGYVALSPEQLAMPVAQLLESLHATAVATWEASFVTPPTTQGT